MKYAMLIDTFGDCKNRSAGLSLSSVYPYLFYYNLTIHAINILIPFIPFLLRNLQKHVNTRL